MALNIPIDKQDIDDLAHEDNFCFKCGGELTIIEDYDFDETGCVNASFLVCEKCGQVNNWTEKEKWLKNENRR